MPRQDMRLIEVMLLSEGARGDVLDVLEAEGLDYNVSDRTDNPNASGLVSFPIPAPRVESVQERLASVETTGEMYTIVYDPETVVSNRFGTANTAIDSGGAFSPDRISRRELHSKAAELLPDYVIYTVLTGVSAIVMTAGVLLEALSVLIGAMVIAPLLGPVLATGAATTIDDRTLFSRGMSYQLRGGAMALLGSTAFAWLAKTRGGLAGSLDIASVLSLSQHTAPAYLLATIAVGAGIAGAVSLATNSSTELVGVMVAAAIMPAFATAGVAIAWLRPVTALGSLGLAVMNVAILNVVAVVTFWYLGYQPMDVDERSRVRGVLLRRGATLVVASVVLGLFVSRLHPETTVGSLLGPTVTEGLSGVETRLQTVLS
ncbi:TIGR00341 family protein [Halolamina litorea]|uniref:TIGR00341 family protein n=1 Tax=Halolamina litorea TaxID=1515593 RepID=A0ABD6BUE4_9EURY|nr:TIGR00341 family protein [Halolamina litorea]